MIRELKTIVAIFFAIFLLGSDGLSLTADFGGNSFAGYGSLQMDSTLGEDGSMQSTATMSFSDGVSVDRSVALSTDYAGELNEYWTWSNAAKTLTAGTYAYVGESSSVTYSKSGTVTPSLVKAVEIMGVNAGTNIFAGCFAFNSAGLFSSSQAIVEAGTIKYNNAASATSSKVATAHHIEGTVDGMTVASFAERGNAQYEPYEEDKLFFGPGYGENAYGQFALSGAIVRTPDQMTLDGIQYGKVALTGNSECTASTATASQSILGNTPYQYMGAVGLAGKGIRMDYLQLSAPIGGAVDDFGLDIELPFFEYYAAVAAGSENAASFSHYTKAESSSSAQNAYQRAVGVDGDLMEKSAYASLISQDKMQTSYSDSYAESFDGLTDAPSSYIKASLSGTDTATTRRDSTGVQSTTLAKGGDVGQMVSANLQQNIVRGPVDNGIGYNYFHTCGGIDLYPHHSTRVWDPELQRDVDVVIVPEGQSILSGRGYASTKGSEALIGGTWSGRVAKDITTYKGKSVYSDDVYAWTDAYRGDVDVDYEMEKSTMPGPWQFNAALNGVANKNKLNAFIVFS
jgi:hypothetical protein